MDDMLELLETVMVDHVQGNSFVCRIQSELVKGDNILVLDNEIGQQIAFHDDFVLESYFPENAERQGESHDAKDDS